mmetsp:Transcript_47093/g.143076  ORF Transcript_47093/g.143076 Transcript_47093/m.143076 type:complete len:276 (+) Transcript_47093:468-1295(+)
MDNFATASCSWVIDVIVCEWNICPMNPESKNGSSGCGFAVGPGIVCTNCANKVCMFWSCIMAAMAFVSNEPSHSGGGVPLSSSSAGTTSASAPSGASSSSSPCASVSSLIALGFLVFFAAACAMLYSGSCMGRLMSWHMERNTSKAPPCKSSNWVIARSVLRKTSRTCTGFRRASVDCRMKSTSCNNSPSSGLLSNSFVRRGSIFKRLRMKSWSFSKLCIAGDSNICCKMSGLLRTCRCNAPNWLGIVLMSMPSGPSPPVPWLCNKKMVLLRWIP